MEEITLEDVMNVAFDILEENNAINYTKKYNREYLIEGFSQKEIPQWEWFGYKDRTGLTTQLSRRIPNKINEYTGDWFTYFMFITGYKLCYKCKKIKEHIDFVKDNSRLSDKLSASCSECNTTLHKEWADNKRKINPNYFKAINAKQQIKRLNRIPLWSEKEQIEMFYNACPENYHIDHIIPLQGVLVSGLHVIGNLQYLLAHDNLVKHNKFDIIGFNNL